MDPVHPVPFHDEVAVTLWQLGIGLAFAQRQEDVLPAVHRAVAPCMQMLTDKVILIPQTVVQPFSGGIRIQAA